MGVPPYPGGPLLQVNEIHLKGLPPLHSKWVSLQGSPLLQSEWDSPPGGPPYPGGPFLQVNEIHLKGFPLSTANGIRFKGLGVPFSNANEICFKGVPFSKANGIRFKGFPLSTATVFRFKSVLRLRITPLRDPICGLLLPYIFPSKGDKEADESSLTAPVKAMINFIFKSFPDAQKSPSHPSSRSFEELQTLRFPRDCFWPSALRYQMPSLTLNRVSLIALRMDGYAILCCLLSTSSRRSPIRLLKEVS